MNGRTSSDRTSDRIRDARLRAGTVYHAVMTADGRIVRTEAPAPAEVDDPTLTESERDLGYFLPWSDDPDGIAPEAVS